MACGANNHVVNPVNLSAEVETKLVELRNRFFATASVTEMVNLSQEAKSIAPDAFVSHELAGELALLQARGGDANRHFLGALALSTATDADHILARIGSLSLSTDEMRSLVGILSACIERTPEGQKQLYGVHLYEYAVQLGDTEGIQLSQKTMTGILTPFLIGPFDNDLGKGFNVVYPPERLA